MATLNSIVYNNGKLNILDQLLLPEETRYISVDNVEDGWQVIKKMQVRGAPAIGIVAGLSLAIELRKKEFDNYCILVEFITKKMDYLITSRPTAVNIVDTKNKLLDLLVKKKCEPVDQLKQRLLGIIESMQIEDIKINMALSKYGADHILSQLPDQNVTVLTHCNTGSLATGGYGTALGVVRTLFSQGNLKHCYFTETRPYNQGSRLTAYELLFEKIPSTLICDNMVAMAMSLKQITAVFVGADRVVANGDTANKIGTYQLAILASHFKIPFYVCAPTSSIDLTRKSGEEIVIEERPPREMSHIQDLALAPADVSCWNPAFDVTPAALITGGIVTEYGVFTPVELEVKVSQALKSNAID